MKIAVLKFNEALSRWEATYHGQVVASSSDKEGGPDYLRAVIEGGLSKKARKLGITKVEQQGGGAMSFGPNVSAEATPMRTVEQEFSINERFDLMEDYVDMVAAGDLASTLVTGEGGLGKSFTVLRVLKRNKIQDLTQMEVGARFAGQKGYVVVKGYSTPKGLFRTLYENRNQLIIFDDCDSVLRDPTAVNLLKAALDSYDKRIVTWNAESSFGGDDDLQKSFEFTGGVIFISNMSKTKVPQAIRSRAMCADVSMTRAEVVERMRVIIQSDEFMPDYEMSHKLEALEFVAEHANDPMITELNLRSLVNVVKARAVKPESWKRLGLYSMANS